MLFFLVFYALIMYAHVYTLHDVLLLCNTTNLRILSSLRGDSIKRWFTICVYTKSKFKPFLLLAVNQMPTSCKPISKKEKTISPFVCQLVANRFQIEGKTILEKPLKWIASGPTRAQLEHNRGLPQQGNRVVGISVDTKVGLYCITI